MLPFSNIDFLLLSILPIGFIFLAKENLSKYINYPDLLLFLSYYYLIIFFPDVVKLSIVVFASWLVIKLFYKQEKTFWVGYILLLLPLILSKIKDTHDIISYAGLSYASFKIIHLYHDYPSIKHELNLKKFLLFLVFPPTLLIGPIDRFQNFNRSITAGYSNLNAQNLYNGINKILSGLILKLLFAETLVRYVNPKIETLNKTLYFICKSYYSFFYLYFDFAGYSLMAIGLALCLGIQVHENFNLPFLSKNPQDFWRRFHITLGNWLNDYFFKPLYKKLSEYKSFRKKPLLRQNVSIFLTFLLMGLWNGTKLNFLLSGALFGLYSVLHNSYNYYYNKFEFTFEEKINPKLLHGFSVFLTVTAASVSIAIFSGYFI